MRPDDKTKVTIIRKGMEKNIIVNLGTRPNEKDLAEINNYGENLFDIIGLRV